MTYMLNTLKLFAPKDGDMSILTMAPIVSLDGRPQELLTFVAQRGHKVETLWLDYVAEVVD